MTEENYHDLINRGGDEDEGPDLDEDEVAELFEPIIQAARASLTAAVGEPWADNMWLRLVIEQLAARFGPDSNGNSGLAGWVNMELGKRGTRYELMRTDLVGQRKP